MTRKEIIKKLDSISKWAKDDPEVAHGAADNALLDYIGSPEVAEAYESIEKWYC